MEKPEWNIDWEIMVRININIKMSYSGQKISQNCAQNQLKLLEISPKSTTTIQYSWNLPRDLLQKEAAMAKSTSSNKNYIPSEIAFVILAKVSVKPLTQFKSIYKTWKNVIKDHKFVKLHLDLNQKEGNDIILFHNLMIVPEL